MRKNYIIVILCFWIAFGLVGRVKCLADDRTEKCTIKVSIDDKMIDLSGVVLDIYYAECTYSDAGSHQCLRLGKRIYLAQWKDAGQPDAASRHDDRRTVPA